MYHFIQSARLWIALGMLGLCSACAQTPATAAQWGNSYSGQAVTAGSMYTPASNIF